MQRVPELAGRELTPDRAERRHHEPQLPGRPSAGDRDRYVIRLAGNDTHLLGISREVEYAATVAAAGVGVGPEVTAFIRPEGYLVTRFIEGSPVAIDEVRQRGDAGRGSPIRSGASTADRPSRACSCRSASSRRIGRWRMARGVRIPPEYELAAAIGRRIELACLADADRAAAVPQRPAQRELHRRWRAHPHRRLGVRGHGRPVLRSRQLQHQP